VLDVSPEASAEQIVKAFRKKAKLFHPDRVGHLPTRLQELAAEEFRRVRTAYEQLTRHTARPLEGVRWPHGVPHYDSPYDYTSEHYEALARANPGNTDILYNLAWSYFEEGRLAESIAGFERVLDINPDDNDAWYNLMIVRLCAELEIPPVLPQLEE
jgi:curved DNA-binding protein CbpA